MDDFYRTPILQVRDARAVSNRSDVEALKNFFDNPPPFDPEANPRAVSHSLGKSTDSRKQGKKKFFGLGKKRLSASDLEAEPYTYGLPKSLSQPIPAGTTRRTVYGHTVIMIGSPVPPLAKHKNFQTPKLEITPASPITSPSPPVPSLQPQSPLSTDPAAVRMNAMPVNPLGTLTVAKATSETVMTKSSLPRLTESVSESEYKPVVTCDVQNVESVSSIPFTSSTLSSAPDLLCLPSAPQDAEGPCHVDVIHAGVESDTPCQEGPHPSALTILQNTMVAHDHRGVLITEVQPSHSALDEFNTQVLEKENTSKHGNYQTLTKEENPPSAVPTNLIMPPTPPATSSSIPALQKEASGTSIQSTMSLKKRSKKHKVTSVSHNTRIPGPNQIHQEIIYLEEMVDKERAFGQLLEIYKCQMFLREEEKRIQNQTIADLSAGNLAQKMEIRQLQELLKSKGVSASEIQSMGVSGDRPSLSREGSADTIPRVDNPNLDPSRFALLRKEEQFGRMWQFGSTQGSFATLENDSHEEGMPNDTSVSLALVKRVKASVCGPPLTPAPSMPLPPVPSMPLPSMPRSRRTTQPMFMFNSAPLVGPMSRSRSLTEAEVFSIPYIDSFTIEQKMRELERDFSMFLSGKKNMSTQSVDSGSNSEGILEFYEALGDEDFSPPPTAKNPQFVLGDQDVEEEADTYEIPIESVPAAESLSHSGSCISLIRGPSPPTFHTPELTNGPNDDLVSSINLETVAHNNGTTDFGHDALIEHARTRHTVFENVPSIDISVTSPSPRATSIDDHTWGTLFRGLMRRSDIGGPVTGDPTDPLEA